MSIACLFGSDRSAALRPGAAFWRASRLTIPNPRRREGWACFTGLVIVLAIAVLIESPRTHQDGPLAAHVRWPSPTVNETRLVRIYDVAQVVSPSRKVDFVVLA